MALIERSEGLTIAGALAARATADPESTYLVSGDETVSYGEVESQSDALAAAMAGRGIESGDRIALLMPPVPEFVVALFAAAKLGAVVVPLNPRLTVAELQYMLRHSEAAAVVTIEQLGDVDYLQLFEDVMPQLPDLRFLVTVGEEDLWYDDHIFQFEDMVSAGAGRDFAGDPPAASDVFAVVYTSGTEGKPKGVELSHANVVAAAHGTADALGLEPSDRVIGISSLAHAYGIGPGLMSTALAGSALILLDAPNAAATLKAAGELEATVHHGTPTAYLSELSHLGQQPGALDSLRLAVISGAPTHDELVERVLGAFGVPVVTCYSVTETASTLAASRPDDPEDKRRFTAGRPISGTEVRVVEDGAELPVESVGEIAVRGPGVMVGYYRQPNETAQAFDQDGFFLTGDLGLLDEEGYLHLVGRTRDVIIRSGFNVYPREVETRIESHPAVREVAAVGVPDPLLGEAICACVVPVEGAIVTGQEIVDWARGTLADDKVPDQVRFIDSLPRTDNGKVRRVELSRSVRAEGQTA